MINLILFILVILISFIIVRIGAIAFQLTGLEHSLAQFQALSCFSGTGFTTRESELVVSHPQRRKIASTLIVLGNAGLVTMIATFANSLRPGAVGTRISLPFLKEIIPAERLPWVNLGIIILLLLIIYRLFTHRGFTIRLTNLLRKFVLKQEMLKRVSFEELLIATGGYGVSRIRIGADSSILNKTLLDSKLRSFDITVLAIIRGHETIPNPPAETSFTLNDELLCFGRLENIQQQICAVS